MAEMTKAQRARNPEMLLKVVCEEFRTHDKYQRGIISSSAFARVFADLNLDFGGAEADEIMKYVTVSNDGFVHFKSLMLHIAPKHTAAMSSIGKAIAPEKESKIDVDALRFDSRNVALMNPTQRRQFIIDRTEAIRKIYSDWDRGALDNNGFKGALTEIGIPISEELHRIIDLNDASRALSFGKVIQALQIGDYMQHKARDPESLTTWSPLPRMHRAQMKPRNPVSWQDPVEARSGDAIDDGSLRHYISKAQSGDVLSELKAVICAYMVGSIPTVEFVSHLDRHGVPITQELQRLLRQQQTDNRATFRDYVRAIFPKRTEYDDNDQPSMLAYLAGVSDKAPAQLEDEQDPDYMFDEGFDPHLRRASAAFEERHGHFGPGKEGTERYGYADETGIDSAYHHAANREEVDDTDPRLLQYMTDEQMQQADWVQNKAMHAAAAYARDDDMDPDAPPPMPAKKDNENFEKKKRLYRGYGDIISWNDGTDTQQKPVSDIRVHRDFVSNPSIISHAEPESPTTQKPRRFPQKPRPVPFGTDADVGSASAPIQPSTGQMRRGYRGDRW